MEKNNSSLLMTILGGVVFCFVFLGLAFVFTNNTRTYKNLSNEEINVGEMADTEGTGGGANSSCAWVEGSWGAYTCSPGGSTTTRPTGSPNSSSQVYIQFENINDSSGYGCYQANSSLGTNCTACHKEKRWTATCTTSVTCYRFLGNACSSVRLTSCNSANNEYSTLNECKSHISCGTGYKVKVDGSGCERDENFTICAAGTYYIGQGACSTDCPANYWCPGGVFINSDSSRAGINACVNGTVSPANSTKESDCKKKPCVSLPSTEECLKRDDCAWDYTNYCHDKETSTGTCTVTATNVNGWQRMSRDESISVRFTVTGDDCGQEVETHLTYFSGPSSVKSGTTGSFTPTSACKTGKISGCIKGTDICSNTVSVNIENVWSGPKNLTDQTSSLSPNKSGANVKGVCTAYENCVLNKNTNKYDCEKWTRCCPTSGGGTGTSAKCYLDENNIYHWTSSPESSWTVVSKTKSECENADACFEKPDGTRVWGKYYDQISNGYRLITSIKDETTCVNENEDDACYVNNNDATDYKWSSTALEGYTKTEITEPGECQPSICYMNIETDEYKMGKYEDDGKYVKVLDEDDKVITDINKCKAPVNDACYKNKTTGEYVWGTYLDDADYELVTTITNATSCTNEVPVPATGINLSKLIYIFMAILMACGVGFIYYSSVVKKNS